MRSLPHIIALVLAAIIVGCTSQGNGAEQKVAAKSGNVSAVEHRSEQLSNTSTPAATNTMQPAATKTGVVSPPSIQPTVTTQKSTTTLAPTPSATVTLTATAIPTTAPTATVMPSTARPAVEIIADSALAEQGIKIYQEQYCGICHQLNAAGTAGLFGPTHNGFAQTAEQRLSDPHYTGTARTAAEYVRESILNPESYVVGGYEFSNHRMPAYVNLNDADLEALVQLLLQQ